ncbi:MAG: creatininase family protein [Fimbriimonadaceae bacterium]
MKLNELTWQDVNALDRVRTVVIIPMGAVEQHGPHLPLGTDTFLASAAAGEIAAIAADVSLLTPCMWLGASLHHTPFPGTLSHSFEGFHENIRQIVNSLADHNFIKFMAINGHGGNIESMKIVFRDLRHKRPNLQLAATNYFDFIEPALLQKMKGPIKGIRHACEAEVSLMLHKHPNLVRKDRLRDDGLASNPEILGLISNFDEITEEGSFGYATLATPELGAKLWESIIKNGAKAVQTFSEGYSYVGIE